MTDANNVVNIYHSANRDADHERRQCSHLVRYWEQMRGDRAMPVEDDIDDQHEALRALWDHCFIVQVRDFQNTAYNYTYLGAAIVDAYENTLENADHKHIVSLDATKLAHVYREVMEQKRPIIYNGEYSNTKGALVKFRQCLLPFGPGEVDVIFGHISYQSYA